MTYHRVEPGVARIMALGLEHELPSKIEEWQKHLAEGRLSEEMRQVFVGLGWLSSLRDRRLSAEPEPPIAPTPTPVPALPQAAEALDEPTRHGRHGRSSPNMPD